MMKTKIKILIISVYAGIGHIKAANAVKSFADSEFENIEIIHMDFFEHIIPLFKNIYAAIYVFLIKYLPSLHGRIYYSTDQVKQNKIRSLSNEIRLYLQNLFAFRLRKKIRELEPDFIVFTHPLPVEHFSKFKNIGLPGSKFAVIITDFYAHRLWLQNNMDIFFVADEKIANRLIEYGVDKNKIHITGIPIEQKFSKQLNRNKIKSDMGLEPDIPTILLMSGAAYNINKIDFIADHLLTNIKKKFQIIALTGNNRQLFCKLLKLEAQYQKRIKVIRFTNKVHEYMTACDFAITKTGGLTTAECLAKGLPVITVNPIPGQESENADYIVKNETGFNASNLEELTTYAEKLISNNELLSRIQANAKKLAKPEAGYEILKILTDCRK